MSTSLAAAPIQKPHPKSRNSAMAIKKSDLYASLWQSCDELRVGMDASQYKDYVLVLLFIKYISDKYATEERQTLQAYLALVEQESDLSSKIKTAQEMRIAQVADQYTALTEDDIKTLVVYDKWLATLANAVQGELDRVTQTLTTRIRQLAERYATPLPMLNQEITTLRARVNAHLKKRGVQWSS